MLKTALASKQQSHEPSVVLGRRLTTFSISKTGDHSTINIIGCFHLEPIIGSIKFAMGKIRVGDNSYIVYDRQAMDGMPAKKITEETCLVLLDEDRKLKQEAMVFVVDDTAELLSLLEE